MERTAESYDNLRFSEKRHHSLQTVSHCGIDNMSQLCSSTSTNRHA